MYYMSQDIHGVVSIDLEPISTLKNGTKVRTLVITREDGSNMRINVYSDLDNALNVKL